MTITTSLIRQLSTKIPRVPNILLNNGKEMPAFGLGTWQAPPGEVGKAVKMALSVGYRHVDCAMLYNNEKEIGQGIREALEEGIVKREELFVVTKLWNTFHEREKVAKTCQKSLENFGLDYVDLYLIHWPVAQRTKGPFNIHFPFEGAEGLDYDYVDTWKGMEECVSNGLTKSIGISNFNAKQITRVLDNCNIRPVTNQIEVNLFMSQRKMISFCKDRDIVVTAYSPLGSPSRPWANPNDPKLDLNDPKLVAIANNNKKSVGQILMRYVFQLGTVPIPKSTNEKRLAQNIDIFDFQLTDAEMQVLYSFDRNFRAVNANELKGLPNYPFDDWI